MDTQQLWEKVQLDSRLKPFCLGVYASNRLPRTSRRPVGLVANLDIAEKAGSHWIAIILLPHERGELFCSFGLPPASRHINEFMDHQCSSGWLYNSTPLQHPLSSVCGHFCIVFLSLRARGLSMAEIVHLFSPTDFQKNDLKVKAYIKKLYS